MTRSLPWLRALLIAPLLTVACDPAHPAPTPDADVRWTPCDDGTDGECAVIDVPLDPARPDGETLGVFVKRYLGAGPGHRQLWLLAGGPGGAGSGFEPFVAPLRASDPGLDIYLPDHRGTGRSQRLGCPSVEAADGQVAPDAWPACVAEVSATWGDRLAHLSVTAAAADLGALIERTRQPGQEVHLYAQSYGTLWAQRYLQLFPDQPTAVTLDGLCQVGHCALTGADARHQRVGLDFLAACDADPSCAARLGGDAAAAARAALDVVAAGTCAGLAGVDVVTARRLLAGWLERVELRMLIPAFIHRALRCDDGDVAAFRTLFATLAATPPPGPPPGFSWVLNQHLALTELEVDPPALAALDAAERDAIFWTGISQATRRVLDLWPRQAADPLAGAYPATRAPLLLLNGSLDPQTAAADAVAIAAHYAAPGQTYVELPRAAHVTVQQSPVIDAGAAPCGVQLWAAFLADPRRPVDDGCVDRIAPLDFAGDATLAAMWGSADLWDNLPLPGPAPNIASGPFLVSW